jgi:hypothetical protein
MERGLLKFGIGETRSRSMPIKMVFAISRIVMGVSVMIRVDLVMMLMMIVVEMMRLAFTISIWSCIYACMHIDKLIVQSS